MVDRSQSGVVSVVALREAPRSPGRYTVTLSDGRALVVGVAALADAGATQVGAVLGSDAIDRLSLEASVGELVARGVGMLARGRRTRLELEQRLRRRQPDLSLVRMALDRLEGAGLLSEDEVARAEAASQLRRGIAPSRVRQTLRSKGISGPAAAAAVAEAEAADGFEELDACRQVAVKRLRSLAALDPVVARRRLIGFLQRRGFGGGVVFAVVDEISKSSVDP